MAAIGELSTGGGQRQTPISDGPFLVPRLFDRLHGEVAATLSEPIRRWVMGGDDQATAGTQRPMEFLLPSVNRRIRNAGPGSAERRCAFVTGHGDHQAVNRGGDR